MESKSTKGFFGSLYVKKLNYVIIFHVIFHIYTRFPQKLKNNSLTSPSITTFSCRKINKQPPVRNFLVIPHPLGRFLHSYQLVPQ